MVRTDFFENLNFEPGNNEENTISIKDISSTVAYILTLSRNTIVDEVNLSPLNKAIKFKPHLICTPECSNIITNDKNGLNFSYKRITISTSGIIPKIKTFINDKIKYNLAISLNATTDSVRDKLMPINKKWPIKSLIEVAFEYNKIHKSGLTFEYVLIDSVNDSEDDAVRLARLFKNSGCKINIIPFNEIGNIYKRPSNYNIENFVSVLNDLKKGFTLLVRWSKGTSINAGCGQLAIKNDIRNS